VLANYEFLGVQQEVVVHAGYSSSVDGTFIKGKLASSANDFGGLTTSNGEKDAGSWVRKQ
jgi:hypothetical protein